jgi:hypothetical protein
VIGECVSARMLARKLSVGSLCLISPSPIQGLSSATATPTAIQRKRKGMVARALALADRLWRERWAIIRETNRKELTKAGHGISPSCNGARVELGFRRNWPGYGLRGECGSWGKPVQHGRLSVPANIGICAHLIHEIGPLRATFESCCNNDLGLTCLEEKAVRRS